MKFIPRHVHSKSSIILELLDIQPRDINQSDLLTFDTVSHPHDIRSMISII